MGEGIEMERKDGWRMGKVKKGTQGDEETERWGDRRIEEKEHQRGKRENVKGELRERIE
jgi:hypothetical protein